VSCPNTLKVAANCTLRDPVADTAPPYRTRHPIESDPGLRQRGSHEERQIRPRDDPHNNLAASRNVTPAAPRADMAATVR
jgi:hypothetical protein